MLRRMLSTTSRRFVRPMSSAAKVDQLFERVQARDPHQPEFLQAVEEVLESLKPVIERNPEYLAPLERLCEPERAILFRVPWMDDKGEQRVNRGMRVQFNSAIGPYKGGLRFHPSVNLGIIKFLGFEQVFKNSLTTLPMGGGKGGSDFDPKGKSDMEVMRFCQSFMTELHRHIGPNCDVPAGDIGVGGREVGFMFGQYKRLVNNFEGVLTGKPREFGGSLIRPEATGYGTVYFVDDMLQSVGKELKGKKVLVSGSGNVSQYAIEKLLDYGAIPLTFSDSNGTIYEPNGVTREMLADMMKLKEVTRGRCSDWKTPTSQYFAGKRPWDIGLTGVDIALPCATQNEVDLEGAKSLVKSGVWLVAEGSNMGSDNAAIEVYHKNNVFYGPAKAANAGGVAVSGLEMSQNSLRLSWTREEVDGRLRRIMKDIFDNSNETAKQYGTHLQAGANIAGFVKVAKAMNSQGCV